MSTDGSVGSSNRSVMSSSRRQHHRRVDSSDDDSSYVYEIIEDEEEHANQGSSSIRSPSPSSTTTASSGHYSKKDPPFKSNTRPSSSGSHSSGASNTTMTDGKLRVLYNSVNNRSRPIDQKLQPSHSGSGDENEYITEVIEEEEVIDDSDDDDDHDEGNDVFEVIEEEEVVVDDDDDDDVIEEYIEEPVDDTKNPLSRRMTNLSIVSINEDEVLEEVDEEEEVDDDDDGDDVGEDVEELTLGEEDEGVQEHADSATDPTRQEVVTDAAAPEEDEEEEEDDGVTKDELAECIEYILRQEKAVANFILTEDQADVMMNLPKKIMKLIVDHLEICDNTGCPIDWDFLLKIVLPFCDKAQQSAEDDEDDENNGTVPFCLPCDNDDHDDTPLNKNQPQQSISNNDSTRSFEIDSNHDSNNVGAKKSNTRNSKRLSTSSSNLKSSKSKEKNLQNSLSLESSHNNQTADDDDDEASEGEVTYISAYDLHEARDSDCDSSISLTSKHEDDEDDTHEVEEEEEVIEHH